MYSLATYLRKTRNWVFYFCTGRRDFSSLDEEHYRTRILVMTSCFWLVTVFTIAGIMPFLIELTPEGALAADVLYVTAALGVLLGMMVLRMLGNRMVALNLLLLVFSGAFAAGCLIFGGTSSPTYPLLLLAPAMAGLVGSISLSIAWGVTVLAFWAAILAAERVGFEFTQIIVPHNHSLAMMLAYTALAVAVVSIIIIYAEMNRALRMSLQDTNTKLEHLSSHDQLTRLPNRRFYDERIARALHRSAEHNAIMALMLVDLNEFKAINDTHGHGAGDKVLVAVAQRLQHNLRETDLVARLGGDEFAVILEDVTSPDEVTRIAHKLAQSLEQPISVRQHQLFFSASIGIAIFPMDGRQKLELEEKADKAMYLAKKRGIPVALSSLEATNMPMPARAPTNRI